MHSVKFFYRNRWTHITKPFQKFQSFKSWIDETISLIIVKVRVFWEGHKIWKKFPLKIWHYSATSNFKWKIFSNCVAFSEYPHFNFNQWEQVMWFITRLILTNSNWKPPIWAVLRKNCGNSPVLNNVTVNNW